MKSFLWVCTSQDSCRIYNFVCHSHTQLPCFSILYSFFNQIAIPLHKFYRHDLYFGQCQIFTDTSSRPSAKHKGKQLLMFFVFIILPPFRNEIKGIFKVFRIMKDADPSAVNKKSFFDRNICDGWILTELSLEKAWSRGKHSWGFRNNASQVL